MFIISCNIIFKLLMTLNSVIMMIVNSINTRTMYVHTYNTIFIPFYLNLVDTVDTASSRYYRACTVDALTVCFYEQQCH